MKKIWIGLVRLCGWKFHIPDIKERPEIKHCVLIMAPHTCIADFFVGAAVMFKAGTHPRIFMKKEFFNWFCGPILKHYGVIPVDRGNKHNNLVQMAVDELKHNDDVLIVLTPEATRKPVKRFKHGFYDIATQAGVPIVMGWIDFKRKEAGYGPTLIPSGDYDADFVKMIDFFSTINPKHPEGWYWGHKEPVADTTTPTAK